MTDEATRTSWVRQINLWIEKEKSGWTPARLRGQARLAGMVSLGLLDLTDWSGKGPRFRLTQKGRALVEQGFAPKRDPSER